MAKQKDDLADRAVAVLVKLNRGATAMAIAGIMRRGGECSSSEVYAVLMHDDRVDHKSGEYGTLFWMKEPNDT